MERVILGLNCLLLALLTFFDEFPGLDNELLLAIDDHDLREDLDVQDVVLVFDFNRLIKCATWPGLNGATSSRVSDRGNLI